MSTTLTISLPDELRDFIEANSGDGTPFATPSDFVEQVLRNKHLGSQTLLARNAILAGYQDAIAGRTVPFKGNLRAVINQSGS